MFSLRVSVSKKFYLISVFLMFQYLRWVEMNVLKKTRKVFSLVSVAITEAKIKKFIKM